MTCRSDLRAHPTPGRRRPRAATRGFSLVEILVALTILALATGVAAITLGGAGETARFRGDVDAFAAELTAARIAALRDNRTTRVTLDLDSRRYRTDGGGPEGALPEEADLDVEFAEEALFGAADTGRTAAFQFFPDGSATGGTISLSHAGRAYAVRIDWLTGNIAVARVDGDDP